ncbi:Bor protein [Arachidicoccus rhizosphaerae]|uniref:Bor protein n=1 Tax=Arachidicoccus rhizosphaerae TaxID=551991 RepID=A0A1H4CIT7_9BACT|nr:Bor family protein [Arachidicoccus rhizosphaerae]SEA60248.1 Bor protein [Arachidicoccus rhizosphaerae]
MRKKTQQLCCLMCAALLFASCYTTRTYVGDIQPNDQITKVNHVTNNFFLWGLAEGGHSRISDKDYVKDEKNYVVEKQQTFVNGLLNVITWGIYCPMTTNYYVPVK